LIGWHFFTLTVISLEPKQWEGWKPPNYPLFSLFGALQKRERRNRKA